MTPRVIVRFDRSPHGLAALWGAAEQARTRRAALYVVHVRPGRRPLPRGVPAAVPPAGSLIDDRVHAATFDALLLTVGDSAPQVHDRVAVVERGAVRTMAGRADRDDDLLVLAAPRWGGLRRCGLWAGLLSRRWRRHGRGDLIVTTGAGHHLVRSAGRPPVS